MNELDRIKKLAGILNEGVMSIPGVGQQGVDEEFELNEFDQMFDGPSLNEWDEDPGEKLAQHQEAIEANIDYYLQKLGVNLGSAIDPAEADNLANQIERMSKDEFGRGINAEDVLDYFDRKSLINDRGLEETAIIDEGAFKEVIQQKFQRAQELRDSMIEPEEVSNIIYAELEQDGHSPEDIEQILTAIADEFSKEDNEDDGECSTCHGTGIGRYGDPDTSRCSDCGGSGQLKGPRDLDDFNEPDDYPDDDYIGPFEGVEETIELGDNSLGEPGWYIVNDSNGTISSGPYESEQEARSVSRRMSWYSDNEYSILHGVDDSDGNFVDTNTGDRLTDIEEAFDLNNGYNDITFMKPGDFFPDGADGPVTRNAGPSGAKQGDNPEQKKIAVAEAHKELVYNYRKFLKESTKK